MFVAELTFECFDNTTVTQVELAINDVLEALRYNGQILGREFPIVMGDGSFTVRVLCPEQESFSRQFNSVVVEKKLLALSDAALLSPKVKWLGRDINSDASAEDFHPSWQVLYTTYIHTCSPLRSGDTFRPIPLYRQPTSRTEDHKDVVQWQVYWQACDEIQMSARFIDTETAALSEIDAPSSPLFIQGMKLREHIEAQSQIPTYYYQYRVGGTDLKSEQDRCCPSCGKQWRLDSPLHEVIYFKCDDCRLVSNLSWNFQ